MPGEDEKLSVHQATPSAESCVGGSKPANRADGGDGNDLSVKGLLEDCPVSYLHVLRQVHNGPCYSPATREEARTVIRTGSLVQHKVSIQQAQKLLSMFYRQANGHYGIQIKPGEEVLTEAIQKQRKRDRVGSPPRETMPSSALMSGGIPGNSRPPVASSTTGLTSSSGPTMDFEAYRKQSLQRQPKQKGEMLCNYYQSKEGCRRGVNCPFRHV